MTEEEKTATLPSDVTGFLGMGQERTGGYDTIVRPPSFAGGTDEFTDQTKKERRARFKASADMLFSTDVSKLDDAGASALYQSVTEGLFGLPDEDGTVAFGKRASKDPRANIDMLRKFVKGDYTLIEDPEYTKWRQMDEDAKFQYAREQETTGNKIKSNLKGERGFGISELAGAGMPGAQFGNVFQNMEAPNKSDVIRRTQYETLTDEEKAAYRADVVADYDKKLSRRQTLATFLQFAHGLSDRAGYLLAKSFSDGTPDAANIEGLPEDERDRVYAAFSLMRGDQKKGRILGIQTDFTDGTWMNRVQLGLYGFQQSVVGLVTDTGEMARDAAIWAYAKTAMDEDERKEFFKGWDANVRAEQAMKQSLPEADGIVGEAFQGLAENLHWFIPYSMIGKGGKLAKGAQATIARAGLQKEVAEGGLTLAKAAAEASRARWLADVEGAVKAGKGAKKISEFSSAIAMRRQLAAVDQYTAALREIPNVVKAAKWKDAAGAGMWAAGEASAFSAFASEYIANADAAGISREESVLTAAVIGLINAKIEQLYVPGLESSLAPAQIKSLTFAAMAQAIKTDGAAGFRKWLANRVSKGVTEGVKVTLTEGAVEEPLQQMATEHGKAFDKLCGELRANGQATLANEAKALWDSFVRTLPNDYATFIDTAADMVPSSLGFGVTTIGNMTRQQHIHNAMTRHANRRAGSTSTMMTARTMQELQGATDYDAGLVDVIQQAVNVRAAVEKHWQGGEDGGETENPHRFEEAITAARRAWRDPQTGDAVQEIANAAGVDVKTAEVLAQYLQTEAEAAAFSPQARAWTSLKMSLADIDEATIRTVLPGYVEGSFASDPENGIYSGRVRMDDGTEKTIAYRVGDWSEIAGEYVEEQVKDGSNLGKSFDARQAEAGNGTRWAYLTPETRRAVAITAANGLSTGKSGIFELTDSKGEKVRVNADDIILLASGRLADIGYGAAATQGTVRHETFHSLWRFVRGTLADADVQQLAKSLGVDVTANRWENELDEIMGTQMERYASGHYVSHAVSSRFDKMLDSWAGKIIGFFGKFGPSDEVTDPKTGKPYQLKGLYDSILRGELGSGVLGVELRKIPAQPAASTSSAPSSTMPVEVTDADRAEAEAEALAEIKEEEPSPAPASPAPTVTPAPTAAPVQAATAEHPADAATPNQRYYKVGLPNSPVKLVGRLEVRDVETGIITSTDADYHDRGNQNRDDKSEESRALVEKIGSNPDPLQIGTVQPIANNGIVWLLNNSNVIIGNHRVNGVRLGYAKGTTAELEKFVREDAAKRGIEIGADVKKPLMVFVLERIDSPDGKADVHEVVRLANESQNRGFNIREQASNDAKILIDNNLLPRMAFRADGRIDETKSGDAIGKFRQESGAQGLIAEDGSLTEEGQTRIQNAALAVLLGGEGNNALLNKIMSNAGRLDMQTELRALMKMTPELMALAEAKPAYDLRAPLAEALQLFTEWRDKDETSRSEKGKTRHDWRETAKDGTRKRGLSWEAFMSQGDMFRTPSEEAKILGDLFAKAESLRSFDREDVESAAGKKRVIDLISDYLTDYIKNARAVNTETDDMFGGTPASRADVLAAQRATGGENGARFSIDNDLYSTVPERLNESLQRISFDNETAADIAALRKVAERNIKAGADDTPSESEARSLRERINKANANARARKKLAEETSFEDIKKRYLNDEKYYREEAKELREELKRLEKEGIGDDREEVDWYTNGDLLEILDSIESGEASASMHFDPYAIGPGEAGPFAEALKNLAESGNFKGKDLERLNRVAQKINDAYKAIERDIEDPRGPFGESLRYSISNLYTGSAADYANRDENGNIVNPPSLIHVGTGEGSQVYGWGLYASSKRGVAEHYAKVGGEAEWKKNGKPLTTGVEVLVERALNRYGAVDLAEMALRAEAERGYDRADELRELREHGNEYKWTRSSEHLYEQTFFTNRAPGDESHLLKWYEPVSDENMSRIANAIKDAGGMFETYKLPSGATTFIFSDKEEFGSKGTFVKDDGEKPNGVDVYKALSVALGSPQAASEFLSRADIDGVKYPVDSYGGKSVKDGETSGWNYVSFRDDNISVDHKWVDGQKRFSVASPLVDAMRDRERRALEPRAPQGESPYFSEAEGAMDFPIRALRTMKDEPERSIEKAAAFMREAAAGRIPKRAPVAVVDNGDGTYTVVDGNATTHAAARGGLETVRARVIGTNTGTRLGNSAYLVEEDFSGCVMAADGKMNLHSNGLEGLSKEDALDKAYAQAEENAPLLKNVLEAAVKKYGGTVLMRNGLKKRPRAMQKVDVDYEDDASRLVDITGGTIVLGDGNDFTDAIKGIRKNLPEGASIAKVKKFNMKPGAKGYQDIKVSIRFANGGIGEVILISDYMNDAKFNLGGHDIYDVQRILDQYTTKAGDTEVDRLAKEFKTLQENLYARGSEAPHAEAFARMYANALSSLQRSLGNIRASLSSEDISTLKSWSSGSHFAKPPSTLSYAMPARSFIQNDISDTSFKNTEGIPYPGGNVNWGNERFSTSPGPNFAYPQLQGMSDDDLIAAAIATRIALGKSDKVSDRSVKINTVQNYMRRLHPDWNTTKIGVESQRVTSNAQKFAKKIREDLDRGVSESLVLEHLPDAMREQFGAEMRQEARSGARLGAYWARANAAVEERQAKIVEDAVRVQTGLDAASIENAYGINLSETIMHIAENRLTEKDATPGATGEGEESADEEGSASAEESEEAAVEIDAKVKAVVDDIVAASGRQAGSDEQNRQNRKAAAGRDAENEAAMGEGEEGSEGEGDSAGEGFEGDALAKAVKKSALDLENPRHLARFVAELARRQWVKEHHLAQDADVWRDLVAVQFLRKTAQSVYAKLCRDLVYSRSRETAMQRIARLDAVPTVAGLLSEMEFVGALINAQRIRDTQKQLCKKLDLFLLENFSAQGRFKPDKEEGKRKVSAEAELRARYMRYAMWLTPDAAAEEARQLQEALDALSVDFKDAGRDRDQSREFVETIRKLNVLREFGALRYKPVGEIEAAIQWWQDFARGESDDIVREMSDRDIRTKKAAHLLAVAFADPKRTTIREGGKADALNRFITGHMGFVSLLQDCMRHASDADAAAVKDIIDYISREIQKSGDRSEAEKRRHNDAFHAAVESIYGKGFNAVMKDMMAQDDRFAKFMGVVGGKRVTPTKGRALQLLVSLLQEGRKIEVEDEENPGQTKTVWEGGYHDNIVKHHREGQAAEIMRLLDPADMNMLKWLGQWYENNRSDLSQVCHSLFGIGVYAELPNYFPVKMQLETQGLEKGNGVGWTIFPKALTPRVRNERDFDTSADIFSMWASRMEDAAQWKHHAKLGLEMRGIFGRAELREAVRANHGASVDDIMQGFITDILAGHGAYDRSTAGVQYFSDQIRGWTALCALGGNVGVMAKQPTSIPAFGFEIGLVNTAKYMVSAFTPEGMAAMAKIWDSEQRRTRWQVGSSEAVRNALSQQNAGALKRMFQASMITNKLGDIVPALVVGQGIYRDCLARGMSEEDAMAETWSIVERTQQSGRMENQTSIQRRNKLGRIMFQFLSTQQQYLQYEVRAIREVIARPDSVKRWGGLGRAILLNHFILSSAYFWMGQLYKYALGQEPPEDELKDWVITCLLGPYGSLFVAGFCCKYTLERAIKGYSIKGGSSMLPMESWLKNQVNDGAKLLEAIFDSDGDTWDNMLEAAGRWMSDSNSTVRDLRKLYRYRVKGEQQKK